MNFNKLGSSNVEVSEVSFGCMSLELERGQNHVSKLIQNAFNHGIKFFDTADLYNKGLNEQMLGKALKPYRDKAVISTKVGNVWDESGKGWNWNPSKEHILTAINESLRRLQTDYIDLYMLHGGTVDDPIDETVEAFERLKKQGKIRAYGISSIRPNTIREWIKRSNMDCVMMQYSLIDRRPEEEILDLLNKNGIDVITRGTLAKGMLIDKPVKNYLGFSGQEIKKLRKVIYEKGDPTGVAIRYVLEHPAVSSAVLGIRTQKQLDNILSNYQTSISPQDLNDLRSVLTPNRYEKHR